MDLSINNVVKANEFKTDYPEVAVKNLFPTCGRGAYAGRMRMRLSSSKARQSLSQRTDFAM